jgi:hypothetical protein
MGMDKLKSKVEAYAVAHQMQLLEPLGSGVDGNVWQVMSKQNSWPTAVKLNRHLAAYERERDCYIRLLENEISEVLDCSVPQLIAFDDHWRVIEMTIVDRPFVLDFAGAYLDFPPDFSEEVWAERGETWREIYGDHWPKVKAIKDHFESLGIYLTDLHWNNIAPAGLAPSPE